MSPKRMVQSLLQECLLGQQKPGIYVDVVPRESFNRQLVSEPMADFTRSVSDANIVEKLMDYYDDPCRGSLQE